jgi:hypothetical protein
MYALSAKKLFVNKTDCGRPPFGGLPNRFIYELFFKDNHGYLWKIEMFMFWKCQTINNHKTPFTKSIAFTVTYSRL